MRGCRARPLPAAAISRSMPPLRRPRLRRWKLDRGKLRQDFFAAFETLSGRGDSTGKVGVVGFCFGGGIANALAVRYPQLSAAVPFYGRQPKAGDVPRIQSPLLLHYAGLDKRINQGCPTTRPR